ncbi:MAG: putative quinol monooxygenase [Formivibrio sp.]|nr:putative quinol monooxygenase [Formivibrio sp.]
MPALTVIATIKAKQEDADFVRAELIKLIAPTRETDAGCISYVLHQDQADASLFYFLEQWENKELLDAHLQTPHIKALVAATAGKLEKMTVALADKIG